MLKIVSFAVVLCLFAGCANPFENMVECKSDEDKISGCIEKGYYENGVLKREIPFENGIRQGVVKAYYDNGQIEYEAYYENGKIIGDVKHYDKSGNLKK